MLSCVTVKYQAMLILMYVMWLQLSSLVAGHQMLQIDIS